MYRHQQTLHFSLNPRAREPLRMILGLGSTKQPLPSALVMGVMSNEAWRAVYGHSLYKRHNKVNHARVMSIRPARRVLAKNTQNFVAE